MTSSAAGRRRLPHTRAQVQPPCSPRPARLSHFTRFLAACTSSFRPTYCPWRLLALSGQEEVADSWAGGIGALESRALGGSSPSSAEVTAAGKRERPQGPPGGWNALFARPREPSAAAARGRVSRPSAATSESLSAAPCATPSDPKAERPFRGPSAPRRVLGQLSSRAPPPPSCSREARAASGRAAAGGERFLGTRSPAACPATLAMLIFGAAWAARPRNFPSCLPERLLRLSLGWSLDRGGGRQADRGVVASRPASQSQSLWRPCASMRAARLPLLNLNLTGLLAAAALVAGKGAPAAHRPASRAFRLTRRAPCLPSPAGALAVRGGGQGEALQPPGAQPGPGDSRKHAAEWGRSARGQSFQGAGLALFRRLRGDGDPGGAAATLGSLRRKSGVPEQPLLSSGGLPDASAARQIGGRQRGLCNVKAKVLDFTCLGRPQRHRIWCPSSWAHLRLQSQPHLPGSKP